MPHCLEQRRFNKKPFEVAWRPFTFVVFVDHHLILFVNSIGIRERLIEFLGARTASHELNLRQRNIYLYKQRRELVASEAFIYLRLQRRLAQKSLKLLLRRLVGRIAMDTHLVLPINRVRGIEVLVEFAFTRLGLDELNLRQERVQKPKDDANCRQNMQ